jgi:hypothetical protein
MEEIIAFYNQFRVAPDKVRTDDIELWAGVCKYLLTINSDKGVDGVLERYTVAKEQGFEGLLDMDAKDVDYLIKSGARGVAIRDKLILEALASKNLQLLESLMDRAYGKALNRSIERVEEKKEIVQVYLPESRKIIGEAVREITN